MLEELKNMEDETSTHEAQGEETNDVDSKSGESATKQAIEKTDEFDYKAELERAQKKIIKLKKEKKEEINEIDDVDEDELVNKIWEKLDVKLSEREFVEKELAYDNTIEKISTNEDEAKLIKYHLENSIKPTGDVEADVRRAKLLSNENRIIKQNRDLAEALKLRSTTAGADVSSIKIPDTGEEQLSASDKQFLRKFKPYIDKVKK